MISFFTYKKILDANDNLSVQVHPNDEYAKKNENGELGKTECWYVIDCSDDAEIIIGHNAKSHKEFVNMVNNNEWDKLLRKVNIKKETFSMFQVVLYMLYAKEH